MSTRKTGPQTKSETASAEIASGQDDDLEPDTPTTTAAASPATSPATFYRPGSLPLTPQNFCGSAPLVKYVDHAIRLGQRTGRAVIVSGPIGIGKTTAVAETVRQLNADPAYVNMYGTDNFREQMGVIWQAMTGTKAHGKGSDIRDQVRDSLMLRGQILCVDEAHILKRSALNSILSIFDSHYTARGRGILMVLCGNDLERHLKTHCPQLLSRCGIGREQKPLAGKALVDTLFVMEPRIEGTDPAVLRAIDNYNFKGDLRRWRDFFTFLAEIRDSDQASPLTADERDLLLGIMPMGTR